MVIPEKLHLAQLPTPIRKLDKLSQEMGCNLYLKQDDLTGMEYSGNKIRKLEYALAEAQRQGADTLITCGGIQSNHCRATVAAGLRLGMKSCLLLRIRSDNELDMEGNYFLDKVMGAEIHFCTGDQYRDARGALMHQMAEDLKAQGRHPYIIPEGASNGIGTFGYYNAMHEIVEQEKSLGVTFDTVVVATGSGGTYSGLFLANKLHALGKRVIGYCVCDDAPYFQNAVYHITNECLDLMQLSGSDRPTFTKEDIEIHDQFVGVGYALSRPEELAFIAKVAQMEGVILDPVYTGKAMYGLYSEMKQGVFGTCPTCGGRPKNVLFIHTGGLFGLFPKRIDFGFSTQEKYV